MIERKKHICYLGCILEANLSSEKSITKVINKVNQQICFLQRVAPLINIKSRKTLGGALIGPLIDYGVLVWYRDAPAALKLKLQTAQNKLIRVVLGLPPQTHLTDRSSPRKRGVAQKYYCTSQFSIINIYNHVHEAL